MSENLRTYLRGVYAFDAVVRRVPRAAWDSSSPCEEWSAREVLGHVCWGTRNIASGVSGGPGPDEQPEAEIAGDDPLAAWEVSRAAVTEALDTNGVLQRTIQSPFGEMKVDGALAVFLGDITMHTWDLATAAGIDHGIPDVLAERVVAAIGAAGDVIRRPGVFGPALEPPPGADAATRMAAIGGRKIASAD